MQKNQLKSRELTYLENHGAKDLSPETARAISEKKIILEDEPLYVRSKINGGGTIKLLTSELVEKVGFTNIDRQRLPKFINFIIDTIQFGYSSAAAADNKKPVEVDYTALVDQIPTALRHANLVVSQNDKPILTLPVKTLLQQEKIRGYEGEAGYQLKYPRMLKEDVSFQISIEFPNESQLENTIHHFVEVILNGTRTKLRGNS
ncbi:MAG: hypothetical protein O9302_03315 [Cyclobacteriaceae bacterium]|nr:hypothetical protein [Cytophagales bacterium]MCZ8327066.1 hypothetical protein [Cyclobacteriaceae bacterium]